MRRIGFITVSEIADGKFYAQLDGSIISLVTDPVALANYTGAGHDNDQIWEPNTNTLPPRGAPVVVILSYRLIPLPRRLRPPRQPMRLRPRHEQFPGCESPTGSGGAANWPTSAPIECELRLSFQHRIYFTDNLFDASNPLLGEVLCRDSATPAKALVVMDEGLHRAQPGLTAAIEERFARLGSAATLANPPLILGGGEELKNSGDGVAAIHAAIDRQELDRHSYVLAIGGGALLDVAGLAAATAHRGLRLVRVPTTTLSQADSGVGVKNGINAFGQKNFIGTFAVPAAVINDFALLASLPEREKRAGFSEAVKVACLQDAEFFAWLEQNAPALRALEPQPLRRLIHHCAELHVRHIAGGGDPFELGAARPLDFGHWSAHKLEQIPGAAIAHGEAVAIGIALDVAYARRAGFLGATDAERVLSLPEALGFALYVKELEQRDEAGQSLVLRGLEEFRRDLGGSLTLTQLQGIGQSFQLNRMDETLVAEAIEELRQRSASC